MTSTASLPHARPVVDVRRLARLSWDAVARCRLDLAGQVVLTEAATGPYSVTPVLAALAGAEVVALTRATAYGSVAEVTDATLALADHLGVADRITITDQRTVGNFRAADVITNSGHVRPIVGAYAAAIRNDAVLSLMFEAWEIQAGRVDLDLEPLRARGVAIAGTNERHPAVDVFSYLGPMAIVQLADAGVSAYGGTIAVLCDNPFAAFLQRGLEAAGAKVRLAAELDALLDGPRPDALVVAMRPQHDSVLTPAQLAAIAQSWPDVVLTQFWGDIDRAACDAVDLRCWPVRPPASGHMGVLPSRVGPEPIVRLQAGGLKVAQVLRTDPGRRTAADLAYLDELPPQEKLS